MTVTVKNGARHGIVTVPASKSEAHRLLICAALSANGGDVVCDGLSKDITATVRCLSALCADINIAGDTVSVRRKPDVSGEKELYCGESGSTLRFLLPVVGALGANAVFVTEGRLSQRPLEPLLSLLSERGMTISREGNRIYCSGKLSSGGYTIPGDISSQYISGLLFALPLLSGDSTLEITGNIESGDYIKMTENAISQSGLTFEKNGNVYLIKGGQRYNFPKKLSAGRDWSGAAFFLCMGAMSADGVAVRGMDESSAQGDKEILNVLERFGARVERTEDLIYVRREKLRGTEVDASGIPDLVPVISAVAAGAEGETRITSAGRLRYKESDRLFTTCAMLRSLGADVEETEDGLIIKGKPQLEGGATESFGDHRIAMSAAAAAGICNAPVVIEGAECAEKSYPAFWNDLNLLEVLK